MDRGALAPGRLRGASDVLIHQIGLDRLIATQTKITERTRKLRGTVWKPFVISEFVEFPENVRDFWGLFWGCFWDHS